MSITISIARAGALASTAFLMGGYIWFQAQNGSPEVVADTTTGQRVLSQAGSHPAELAPGPDRPPIVLPGSKSDSLDLFPHILNTSEQPPGADLSDRRSKILPGPKSGPVELADVLNLQVLPGSKSGTIEIAPKQIRPPMLPGSKSLSFLIDPATIDAAVKKAREAESKRKANAGEDRVPPQERRPTLIPGSKSKAPLISPPTSRKPRMLPGSKSRTPLIPVSPNRQPAPQKPTFLPGSKSAGVRVLPQPNLKARPAPTPPAAVPQSRRTILPGSKAPSSLLTIDPSLLRRLTEQDPKQAEAPPAQEQAPEAEQPNAPNRK